jgi:hypothetical protein
MTRSGQKALNAYNVLNGEVIHPANDDDCTVSLRLLEDAVVSNRWNARLVAAPVATAPKPAAVNIPGLSVNAALTA